MTLSANEVIALFHALSYVSVKDLLTYAMNDMDKTTNSIATRDNANVLFYAIHTYLM